VKPYGWCWVCGLEAKDVILTINDEPARSPDDLRRAIQDPSRTSVVLTSTTPTGGQFRFFLPLPLGEPEMYCMGLLFDQDPKVGFHIVIGLIKNSPAEQAGIVRGSCIRKIDGSLPPLVFDFNKCQYLNICVGRAASGRASALQPPRATRSRCPHSLRIIFTGTKPLAHTKKPGTHKKTWHTQH